MADPFKLMTPGQELGSGIGPFNVEWHNEMSKAGRDRVRRSIGEASQQTVKMPEGLTVWAANVSGAAIAQFTAVGIGEVAIRPSTTEGAETDFRHRAIFVTETLADDRHFGIALDSIAPNELYAASEDIDAGELQPPSTGWIRVFGEAEAWVTATHYGLGEQVTLSGDTYICKLPHTSQTPPNTTYWVKLASNRGIWKTTDTYPTGTIVAIPTMGRLALSGECWVQLTMQAASHQYAGVTDGVLTSQLLEGPLKILWRADNSGVQWAFVRFCCVEVALPTCTGSGTMELGAATCAGAATFIYRPGGALRTGAATMSGSATYTFPTRTASGALTLGAATSSGSIQSYAVPPSGRLFLSAATMAGTATFTSPPIGRGFLRLGEVTISGVATSARPVRTASGTMTLGAATMSGVAVRKVTSFEDSTTFTALISAPACLDGDWVYVWVAQQMNTSTGDYETATSPARSGSTSAGPYMRELNNNLVQTPTYVKAWLRGVLSGQPLYDFDRGCSLGVGSSSGAMTLGAATMAGVSAFTTNRFATGAMTLGAATMSGAAKSWRIGSGAMTLGASTMSGAATFTINRFASGSLTLSAATMAGVVDVWNIGAGAMTLGAATMAGVASAPDRRATGAMTTGAATMAGTATSAAGGSSGGSLTRHALGTTDTGSSSAQSITLSSVTTEPGLVLLIFGTYGAAGVTDALSGASATYNGTTMTSAYAYSISNTNGVDMQVGIFWLATTGNVTGDLVLTMGGSFGCKLAVQAASLTGWTAPASISTASEPVGTGSGTGNTPALSTSSTLSTTKYAEAAFNMVTASSWTWNGDGFSSGGQDVSSAAGFKLTEGYKMAPVSETLEPDLSGVSPTPWVGVVASWHE